MKYLIFASFSVAMLLACAKDGVNPTDGENGDYEQIDLKNMQAGQKNQYVLLIGENYHSQGSHNAFEYREDTLTVEVLKQEDDRFLWLEYLENPLTGLDDSITYWVALEDDQLLIDATEGQHYVTHLFHSVSLNEWNGEDYIMQLQLAPFTDTECNIVGWKTDLPYGESYREAFDPAFSLFGEHFTHVNVIIDNIPMQVDGNGKTYVYSLEDGIIRSVTYSWWTGQGMGWDLLSP